LHQTGANKLINLSAPQMQNDGIAPPFCLPLRKEAPTEKPETSRSRIVDAVINLVSERRHSQ
jgi:hypothetical protein